MFSDCLFHHKSKSLIVGITATILTACGGGGGGSDSPANPPAADTRAPVITLSGSSSMPHEQGIAFTDPGASVTDNVDSNLSVSVAGEVNSAEAGSYTLTYSSSDSAGNTVSETRTVIVADTSSPVIALAGDQAISINTNDAWSDAGATATDTVDGEVAVTVTGVVDNGTAGVYTVTYTAIDVAGNSDSVIRTVTVEDATSGPTVADDLLIIQDGATSIEWDTGLVIVDQAKGWGRCETADDASCPSTTWSVVSDSERGDVLQINHAVGAELGFVIAQTSTPYDLSDYAGGTIEFDVKIISGDNKLTMKSECLFPCSSGDFSLGAIEGSGWVALSVSINELVDQGLILGGVDIGFAIWATDHDSTVFQVDNVRWVANPNGPIASSGNTGGTLSDWVKADPSIGYQSADSYVGYTKVFSDEFDGTELDTDMWRFDIGTGSNGWGNNELEYYREENASVENGLLVIEARKENFGGRAYTSSRIKTEDNFSFTYGRVDVRAVVAEGKGLWSAIWMLGQNFADVSWPYSGEIDIVDTVGGPGNEDTAVHNVYYNNGGLDASYSPSSAGTEHKLSSGATYSNSFHVFSIEWSPDKIIWYVDDVQTHSLSIADGSDRAEAFRKDFFLILNVAIGGDWPGSPVTATQFPRGMLVDYVRVFQLTP